MKQVVIFNGSARRDGNLSTLLDLVARGAREHGGEVSFYTLLKMKFQACQNTFNCRFEKGECPIKDEVSEALDKVKKANAVVIGSPIFMMQMSGPVKNLYDRFYPLTDGAWQPRYGTKKLLTLYAQGADDPATFESYFEYTAAMFPAFGFDLIGNLVCTGANDPESAERNVDLKRRAYDLGAALVA